ncbi:MAG: hypothetical protein ACTSUR_04095 [Candidatus Heimdallarchaeaceae archaeon]
MLENDILSFLKNQLTLEREIIRTAEESVRDVKNELVKELILSIALDSKKHAGLLNAILTLNKEIQPFLNEEKFDQLTENIEKHIQLEQKAIETYKELLDALDDENIKLIINAVYQDELRHHALLKKIQKAIIEKESITQDDIWDSIKDDFIPQF